MTEQRVPAWKRLGLSLTNAKDTAPLPASPATSTKRSRDDADTPKGSKKQRLDQSQNGPNVSSPAQKQLQSSSVAPISSPMPSRLYAFLLSLFLSKSCFSTNRSLVMNCVFVDSTYPSVSLALTLTIDEPRQKSRS